MQSRLRPKQNSSASSSSSYNLKSRSIVSIHPPARKKTRAPKHTPKPKSQPSILYLPTELLAAVAIRLTPFQDLSGNFPTKFTTATRRDLHALLLTCKAFFSVCVPLLWRYAMGFSSQAAFSGFCETLSTSPRAAFYARWIVKLQGNGEETWGVSVDNARKLGKMVQGLEEDDVKFPRLEELSIGPAANDSATDTSVSRIVKQCPSLTSLCIENLEDLKGCFLIRSFPLIRNLCILDCPETAGQLTRIIKHHAPVLEELELANIYPRQIEAIGSCSKLKRLYVDHINVSREEASAFECIVGEGRLPNIENVFLVDAKHMITDHVSRMVTKWGDHLRILCLGDLGNIGNEAMYAVARNCPNLEYLDIGDLFIDNEPLIQIAQHCPNLQHLDVTYNDLITDDLLHGLIHHAHSLRVLYAAEAANLTPDTFLTFVHEGAHIRKNLQAFSAGAAWEIDPAWHFYQSIKRGYPMFVHYDKYEREFMVEGFVRRVGPASRFEAIPLPPRPVRYEEDEDFWMEEECVWGLE